MVGELSTKDDLLEDKDMKDPSYVDHEISVSSNNLWISIILVMRTYQM